MPDERPPSEDELVSAARRLGRALTARHWQMAAAESCTGGLVGHVITQVPRSSDHFLGGIVSYADVVKERELGVDPALIKRLGAVSAEVAEAMADGVLARFPEAHVAVAVTGIAGPDGGSAEKPVGLTYVAAGARGGWATVERYTWGFDRDGNKRASALAALELARRIVSDG
jgi:PncC family amidohydrolase